jgi:Protein of unknown function (DUF3455)
MECRCRWSGGDLSWVGASYSAVTAQRVLFVTIGLMRTLTALAFMGLFVLSDASLWATAQAHASQGASQTETAPDVPDAIQVPAGEQVVLFVRGVGSQIYTCQASAAGKYNWTLKAPDAELRDRKDKVIGQHSAGPSWKLKDGSEVQGKAAAKVESLDPQSVPWLLVKVVSHSGNGLLSQVTDIQRLHTHGGQPPAEGCDEAHKDAETKSSYTADYYFYAPAK